ncbi:phage terminase large subunit family protein [Ancylobacter dichloromethanicus]|uniref:Terminase n=1 Tax=Ancylobacter dichloromethanicus TaxID=518825 RepID=A0A9W6J8L8_9HYPH|nr:phage terminase large subunit family protein [Ancylobacter dichloromethanicus]MBS7554168.1 phage terminase large subunit family protein [Ancylobacter dichloromethanicus]GLK71288.1 terminase [Ancylobacter dichloromethanicus]
MLLELERRARAALRPPPRLPLSEWIERHVVLPADVSALPGPVRLYPFQRGIADAMGDPAVERVTLVKAVRVGLSTLMAGGLASFVANEPAPVLMLLPTEADARDAMVSQIEPLFDASPSLAGLLAPDGDRNTLLSRRFAGGSLKIVAAKSPRNLRRHNVRVLLIDEADAMLPGPEGSPILLAEKRTISFGNRKIIIGSTPLHEETSNVLRSYAASDKRVFEVPCPHCGHRFELLWRHIQWPEGKPSEAHAVCPENGCVIEEVDKPAMVEAGRWRATAPEVQGHAGFRLNALVSPLPNASWSKLAAEFLAAKDDPETLQVFVNTILAEGWKDGGEEVDEAALQARAEPFGLEAIPADVLAITAGCDVQDDRIEVTLCGWSHTELFVLGHVIVWGSPDDDTTWLELDALLKSRWKHPAGGLLKVDAAVVDAGDGDWTERVYAFCFPRAVRRIMAGKGVSGARPAIQASKTKVRGGRLWIVGVDGIKTTLANRLARGRSIRFSETLEPAWFEQLTSERRTVRYFKGQPIRRFERIPGRRAEALDCVVYAYAARHALTLNWTVREEEVKGASTPPVARPVTVYRSRWMDG